jgi:3-isopropylmalate dehydrogenase
MIMSGRMLLEWLGRRHGDESAVTAAACIGRAMERVIAERRALTPDLGGSASTSQMGDAVAAAL